MRSITISSQAWATKLNEQEKKKKTETRNKPGFFSSSLCCLRVDIASSPVLPWADRRFSTTAVLLFFKMFISKTLHAADRESTEALLADGLNKISCCRPAFACSEVLSSNPGQLRQQYRHQGLNCGDVWADSSAHQLQLKKPFSYSSTLPSFKASWLHFCSIRQFDCLYGSSFLFFEL